MKFYENICLFRLSFEVKAIERERGGEDVIALLLLRWYAKNNAYYI